MFNIFIFFSILMKFILKLLKYNAEESEALSGKIFVNPLKMLRFLMSGMAKIYNPLKSHGQEKYQC